jgi:hypoxanthine phosphoribosyltransferase
MAAHIFTYLQEIIQEQKRIVSDAEYFQSFQHALDYAKLGDQLEIDDWLKMHTESANDMITMTRKLLPKYEQRWKKVGEPKTFEEWMKNTQTERENKHA